MISLNFSKRFNKFFQTTTNKTKISLGLLESILSKIKILTKNWIVKYLVVKVILFGLYFYILQLRYFINPNFIFIALMF